MAELNLKQIIDRLNAEFTGETRKLVFWYDDKAEFAEDMETVELQNAKIYHLQPDNQFYTKYFLERVDKTTNYLIYAPFPKPDVRDNHLEDTLLYSKRFYADRASLLSVDLGIDDEANMGAAMAPAACDTIVTHFEETGRSPDYYDGIFTGDLGRHGKEMLEYLLSKEGITLPKYYMDCGASYFTPEQKTFQGGSGAGCVNTVFNSYILKKMQKGELKRVLVVPTGALLNKDTPLQKETIPGISHAFTLESHPFLT